MFKYQIWGVGLAALLFLTNCSKKSEHEPHEILPPVGGQPIAIDAGMPQVLDVPVAFAPSDWGVLALMVRFEPTQPQNERFLDDWRFQIRNIDDQARPAGPTFFGRAGPDGTAGIGLPAEMLTMPLIINAYNEAAPLLHGHHRERCACEGDDNREDDDGDRRLCEVGCDHEDDDGDRHLCEGGCDHEDHDEVCRNFEIFIPPNCFDKAVWMLGPVETAVWDYYFRAAIHRGDAWRPSQVDCATWLANLQLLLETDQINDELNREDESDEDFFNPEALVDAFQEYQNLLVPTRPPICMGARRHAGGGMNSGPFIPLAAFPWVIDDSVAAYLFPPPPVNLGNSPDIDPIVIGANGLVNTICGIPFAGAVPSFLEVNSAIFAPTSQYFLNSFDYMGTVHDETAIVPNMDISFFNIRLGNGRIFDNYQYDDTCSLSEVVQFTNTDDDDRDIFDGTGVTFTDLFGPGANNDTVVWLTSDGNAVVNDDDIWAIFYAAGTSKGTIPVPPGRERVIAVELLGHRLGDFTDVLNMTQPTPESLFLGLGADYTLGDQTIDGQLGFMAYTLTTWSGDDCEGLEAVRRNLADCYEASDVWARQFFITQDFQEHENCDFDECCFVDETISPLHAAEMAVRSQCFSNSRSNNNWQSEDFDYWALDSYKGINSNVTINPGWLAPDMDFELYIQRFDEAVFKGPRVIVRSDSVGQLMTAVPTLVEGDRILIRSQDSCCNDYDLIVPCVPEFTGFAGHTGRPYVPQMFGPQAPVPIPVP